MGLIGSTNLHRPTSNADSCILKIFCTLAIRLASDCCALTSEQGLTLVPVSTQLELTLPLSAQLKLILSSI